MISYIVASHKPQILNANLKATLELQDQDELIVIDGAKTIAQAYNRGVKKAKNRIKCFVHHDAVVVDPVRLRTELMAHCRDDVGMVGLIGTTDRDACPWWDKPNIGSCISVNLGFLRYTLEGGDCSILDGLMLATAQDVEFDEQYEDFHFYDHDICRQMLARGLKNESSRLVSPDATGRGLFSPFPPGFPLGIEIRRAVP